MISLLPTKKERGKGQNKFVRKKTNKREKYKKKLKQIDVETSSI